ncbi:O-antigen/teichoic acid export membrane protein [Palleronia aestuarii]|uniref:O-antigen/teichoic acid export membrane protein n=1 Tax=Palleronia aestuarii TaxID=568105 RepID=A0A2W7MQY7_9RHOB|nr:oligosaccharide flippase family protein [Palleronia aestuarii]PZX10360.1 O-antigen/teichoic acid export membrane protein [Palleronia aestuarii]
MSKRSAAAQNGVWSIILQWSRFGLNTIVFLILARWLSLAEIGAFAIAFAPINLIQNVQRTGFSDTIVQGDTEPGPFTDTIFWMSATFGFALSLCLFGLSFVIGPIVSNEAAGTYLAAMAVIPLLVGIAAVPEGLIQQRLEIRTLALRATVSLTIAGAIALWFGHAGYGGWALTGFAIVNAVVSTILVVALVRWVPSSGLRVDMARQVLPILGAILGRGLAIHATMPLLQLMVGAGLGPVAAGAFQIAQRFFNLAATVALTPLKFAALPVFVQVRGDVTRLRRVVIETAGLVSLVASPVYLGLLALSPLLLPLAVGETNGTASVATSQALLLIGGHVGLYAIFTQSLTAIGRSDIALRWSVGVFVLNMAIGAVTALYSEALTALGCSLLGYAAIPFVLRLLRIHIGIAPWEMARIVFGPVSAAVIMAVCVLLMSESLNGWIGGIALVALEIVLGAAIYFALALLMLRRQLSTTRNLLVTLLPQRLQRRGSG